MYIILQKKNNRTCSVLQLRLVEIASLATDVFSEFKSNFQGISAEHVLKQKIEKRSSFYAIILKYQMSLRI